MITKIGSVSADNPGGTTASLTVPAGVTNAHLGIIVVGTASATNQNTQIPGWTRVAADPSGQQNSAFYVFTRLGGQVAGDTVTATFNGGTGARISGIWYDTAGSDIAIVGTPGTRNATSSANLVIPGLTTTFASQDVIVIATERTTATGTVINSWSPATPTQDHFSENTGGTATNAVSHFFGRLAPASAGPMGNYTATYSGGSTNAAGMMLAVAQPAAPVNNAPTASFTTSVNNLVVDVNAGASTDSDGSIVSYSWNWGDGARNSTGVTASHTYASAGTFTITLTVTDDKGATSQTTRSVTTTAPAGPTPAVASTVWSSEPSATALSIGWIVDKGSSARAVVSLASNLSNPVYSGASTIPASKWVNARVTGLTPDTTYYVGLEVDGILSSTGRGSYKTLNPTLRASKIITSSCNTTGSNTVIFDRIKSEAPDFFTHQGDLHYADTNDETTWRAAWNSTITTSRFAGMLNSVTMTYDWDNHDTGGNGSFKDGTWATFAPEAVRQLTGSAQYPASRALYKTWVHAGVRYIETDRWLERDSQDATNSATKYMLSQAQEDWLLNILATATEPAIIWFSGFPHYSNLVSSGRWGSYPNQRIRIGNAINALPAAQRFKIVCIGGDSHSICADDGTNAMWNLPSLNASPLDKTGGLASGTWNIANIDVDDTRGYYSKLVFTPSGNNLTMRWDAMQDDGASLANWSRTFPVTGQTPWSVWNGTSETLLTLQGSYNANATITNVTVTIV